MELGLLCATVIALLFGALVAFGGYRLFLFLLPIWGFVFGFALGAQTMQALLGTSLFADATALVVGFVVALIFAVLSYLFYFLAVAIIAGSLGYGLVIGFWTMLFGDYGLIAWLVGIVVAVIFAVVTLRFNIQKYVIIVATALGGAALIGTTLVSGVGGASVANVLNAPFRAISGNPLVGILCIVVAIAGIAFQWQANRNWEIKEYNRMTEMSMSSSTSA